MLLLGSHSRVGQAMLPKASQRPRTTIVRWYIGQLDLLSASEQLCTGAVRVFGGGCDEPDTSPQTAQRINRRRWSPSQATERGQKQRVLRASIAWARQVGRKRWGHLRRGHLPPRQPLESWEGEAAGIEGPEVLARRIGAPQILAPWLMVGCSLGFPARLWQSFRADLCSKAYGRGKHRRRTELLQRGGF